MTSAMPLQTTAGGNVCKCAVTLLNNADPPVCRVSTGAFFTAPSSTVHCNAPEWRNDGPYSVEMADAVGMV